VNKYINRVIFVTGWLLSPFTFWNDLFVNIPIAYILALLAVRFLKTDFLVMSVIMYWLTNIIGVFMMILSGKALVKNKEYAIKELQKFLLIVIVYTAVIIVLHKVGVLKPI